MDRISLDYDLKYLTCKLQYGFIVAGTTYGEVVEKANAFQDELLSRLNPVSIP